MRPIRETNGIPLSGGTNVNRRETEEMLFYGEKPMASHFLVGQWSIEQLLISYTMRISLCGEARIINSAETDYMYGNLLLWGEGQRHRHMLFIEQPFSGEPRVTKMID